MPLKSRFSKSGISADDSPVHPVSAMAPLWPWPVLVIAAAAALVIARFFTRGIPSGHDFEFHFNSWLEVSRQWSHGVLYPRWAEWANHGYGEPRFIFYPPLSWILGAALGAVLPWKAVPGAYVWLALFFAGCSMFILARRWLSSRDATFAAVLYVANPYHLLVVYWRSAFGELLVAGVLPLLLLLIVQLGDGETDGLGKTWTVPGLGLLIAAAWLSDAPAGVMVNYSFALLVLAAALAWRSWKPVFYGLLAFAVGMGLAAFYLAPAVYEQRWVDIYQAVSLGDRPWDNFLFSHVLSIHHQFNAVVSLLAIVQLAFLAFAIPRWRQVRRQLPQVWWMLGLWALSCSVLLYPVSAPLWRYLPELRFLQFPWRWLLCLNVGFALLLTAAWRSWIPRAVLVAVLFAVIALIGYRIVPPWWDTAADIAELQDNMSSGEGYDGMYEYVPISADPDQVSNDARRVIYEGSGTDQIHIFVWAAEDKAFSVTASAPGTLVLRLFYYPAWQARVNGRIVPVQGHESTGQLEIPVSAGLNRVEVRFTRTWDRAAGGWISLGTVAIVCGWVIFEKKRGRNSAR